MQNKGFVRVFAILLTLVCVFYLSFSFVTRHYKSKAKEFAKGDVKVEPVSYTHLDVYKRQDSLRTEQQQPPSYRRLPRIARQVSRESRQP